MYLWLFWACTAPTEPPSNAVLEQSWIAEIVQSPQQFATVLERDGRDGWIAIHRNDWYAAVSAGGPPAQRGWEELQAFYLVVSALSERVVTQVGVTWQRRGKLPEDSLLPLVIRWASDEEAPWQALAEASRSAEVAALARSWRGRSLLDPPETAPPPLVERAALHQRARQGQDLELLRTAAAQPIWTETTGSITRSFFDPLTYASLAQGATVRRAGPTTQLFSAQLGEDEASTLAALGLSLPTTDAADQCRDTTRALDATLDTWRQRLFATANPEGQALLNDLRLIEGLRSRLLVGWAQQALGRQMPRCALAWVQMAMDYEHPREITPINSPTLYAVMASAWLATGSTRQALDALEVLQADFPELIGLDEAMGDLVVLEGLGRAGDSREN